MMTYVMLFICYLIFLIKGIQTQGKINYDEIQGVSFSACGTGNQQSPIDIPFYNTESKIVYQPDPLNYINRTVYTLLNNEKLQLDNTNGILRIVPEHSSLDKFGQLYTTIGGHYMSYKLTEVRFHVNSEHTFEGMKTEMEMQLVHQPNKDGPSNYNYYPIIIAVLFSTSWDEDSEILTPLFETKVAHSLDLLNKYQPASITSMNINKIFFKHNNYYYYKGSGTTPSDCSAITHWFIMKKVEKMSWKQLYQLQALMHSVYPNGNSRTTKTLMSPPSPTIIEYIQYIEASFFLNNHTIALVLILSLLSF